MSGWESRLNGDICLINGDSSLIINCANDHVVANVRSLSLSISSNQNYRQNRHRHEKMVSFSCLFFNFSTDDHISNLGRGRSVQHALLDRDLYALPLWKARWIRLSRMWEGVRWNGHHHRSDLQLRRVCVDGLLP